MTPIWRLNLPEVVDDELLHAAGLTRDAVRHALRSGRLHLFHQGVYAVGRPQLSRDGRWKAAVLACGPSALLSHTSAALHWELLERADERPHVSVPSQAGRTAPRGVVLHRAATLTPADRVIRRGIATTSLERTLIDLARTVERPALKSAVRQAQRRYRLDLGALRARVAEPRTSIAHARLFTLLGAYVPATGFTDSELEAALLELCARHRLPVPATQHRFGSLRADFTWHAERLIVETDGRETHDTDVAFLDDRVKDRALKALGYEVLRFTWAEVMLRPGAVAAEIRSALRRRRRELAGSVAQRVL